MYGPEARTFKGVTCGEACELKDSDISSNEWKFGTECISCDDAAKRHGRLSTPKWVLSKACENCAAASKQEHPGIAAGCVDTPGFANGQGFGCADYSSRGWCAKGAAKPGNEWTIGEKFKFPEENCCVCGKKK